MARRSDTPTRSEVTDKVEKNQDDLREKGDEMEDTVSDIETIRETLESLDLGGTADGADEVEHSVEGAEDVSEGEFDEESSELDGIEGETEEHETELEGRSDSTSSDLGRLSDASARLHSDASNQELITAKESAVRDVEFLDDQGKRAEDAREESQRLHEELRARAQSGRSR